MKAAQPGTRQETGRVGQQMARRQDKANPM